MKREQAKGKWLWWNANMPKLSFSTRHRHLWSASWWFGRFEEICKVGWQFYERVGQGNDQWSAVKMKCHTLCNTGWICLMFNCFSVFQKCIFFCGNVFFILWIVQWASNVILQQVYTMFLKHILHCRLQVVTVGARVVKTFVCFVVYWAKLQRGTMVIWKMPSILFCAARV